MQSVIPNNRLQDVRTRVLEEIKATQKRIHPLFNLIMQNKVDHANQHPLRISHVLAVKRSVKVGEKLRGQALIGIE